MNKMANFGKYQGPTYRPNYGDIDWRSRQDALIEAGELDPYKHVGFDSEDGLVTECSQENLEIRLNRVAPHMDLIAMMDYRDGLRWTWFRYEDEPKFQVLVEKLGRAALTVTTEYPLENTVDLYLERVQTGLDPSFLGEVE